MVAFVVLSLFAAIIGWCGLRISVKMDFLSRRRITTHWYDTVFFLGMVLGTIGTIIGLVSLAWKFAP